MEVMSSLLLCALVALLPQTLGNTGHYSHNNTVLIQQNSLRRSKPKVILNVNNPLIDKSHEKDAFYDVNCRDCLECMDRALKKHNIKTSSSKHIRSYLPDMHENELMKNPIERHRDRRDVDTALTASETKAETTRREKKTKSRKNKVHKTVTVTKYNINGEVYALKVKEINAPVTTVDNIDAKPTSTCQVFSVKKAYPCDSPEAYLILAASKTKLNKRIDETSTAEAVSTPNTPALKTAANSYRKRHIDNTQIPENVMPSNEEFY